MNWTISGFQNGWAQNVGTGQKGTTPITALARCGPAGRASGHTRLVEKEKLPEVRKGCLGAGGEPFSWRLVRVLEGETPEGGGQGI